MSHIFFGLFIGSPIGAIVGIGLVDRIMFKSHNYNIYGIVTALILSQVGIILGIGLIENLAGVGRWAVFLIPLIVTCLSLAGYNIILVLR